MFEIFVKAYNVNCVRHLDQLIKYTGSVLPEDCVSRSRDVNESSDYEVPPAPPAPAPAGSSTDAPGEPGPEPLDTAVIGCEPAAPVPVEEDDQWSEAIDNDPPNLLQDCQREVNDQVTEVGREPVQGSSEIQTEEVHVEPSVARSLRPRKIIDYKKYF